MRLEALGLAILVGHAVSSTRCFWAVIASFVIFNRATARGDILLRVWHRILGTVMSEKYVMAVVMGCCLGGGNPNGDTPRLFSSQRSQSLGLSRCSD